MKIISPIILFLIGITSCQGRLREYEESCNTYKASENCRTDLDLVCHDRVCTCKETAYYDIERKTCISKIGQQCNKESKNRWVNRMAHPRIMRCPKDAVCTVKDPNTVVDVPKSLKTYFSDPNTYQVRLKCFCKRGFHPDINLQSCILALELNEACSGKDAKEGRLCDESAGLVCSETGICACAENRFYDSKTRRCLTSVDEPCNSKTFCDRNSICSTLLDDMKVRYLGEVRVHNDGNPTLDKTPLTKRIGTCICLPGYTKNAQGKCLGSFSVACSTENPCNADRFLTCIDGICRCEAGGHQIFSFKENFTCALLSGAPCKTDSGPKCAERSSCSEQGRCECNPGYLPSPEGNCMLGLDSQCSMPTNTNTEMRHHTPNVTVDPCNFYKGLACIGDKCKCFDSQLTWDPETSICTAGVGERCGPISMTGKKESAHKTQLPYPVAYLSRDYYSFHLGYHSDYFVGCAKGLICKKQHGDIERWMLCENEI